MRGEEDWLLEDDEKENGENGTVDAEVWWEKGKGIGRGGSLGSGSKKEWGFGRERSHGVDGECCNGEEAGGDRPDKGDGD